MNDIGKDIRNAHIRDALRSHKAEVVARMFGMSVSAIYMLGKTKNRVAKTLPRSTIYKDVKMWWLAGVRWQTGISLLLGVSRQRVEQIFKKLNLHKEYPEYYEGCECRRDGFAHLTHKGTAFVRTKRGLLFIDGDVAERIAGKAIGFRSQRGYPATRSDYLHNLVFPDKRRGMTIDHISGNVMDARRENLRIATMKDQARNRRYTKLPPSGCRGVTLRGNKYYARVCNKGVGGGFDTFPEAVAAVRKRYAELGFLVDPTR